MGKITKSLKAIYTALGGKEEDVYRAASVAPVLKKIEELLKGSGNVVPITAIDLISMYGLIVKTGRWQDSTALEATTTDGAFEITEDLSQFMASEPVRICNIGASVTDTVVCFVPAYDYSGFTINGAAATTEGDTVIPDGKTLYQAQFVNGTITIDKLGF